MLAGTPESYRLIQVCCIGPSSTITHMQTSRIAHDANPHAAELSRSTCCQGSSSVAPNLPKTLQGSRARHRRRNENHPRPVWTFWSHPFLARPLPPVPLPLRE